jgi:SAM-dependent methyltransferase
MEKAERLSARIWARAGPRLPRVVRRTIWRRTHPPSTFVTRYTTGLVGVEVGGGALASYQLRAINIDRYPQMDTVYKRAELDLAGEMRKVDLVAPGHDLPLKDKTVDYVFASHVIEHIPDPLAALEEWRRVARVRVVLVVPHRDRTFDHGRELTPTGEFLRRRAEGFTSDEDRHWSVWTRESFLAMCDAAGFRVVDSLDPDDKSGDGFMVVLDASA